MKINSVWHITSSGRSLRIDSCGLSVSKRDVVVFTRKIDTTSYIKEDTRIIPKKIAKLMKLHKFIVLSDKTSVRAGSFDIKIEDVSQDHLKYNISINDVLYFLSFIPELIKPMSKERVLLIPADSRYYKKEELPQLVKYIEKSNTKTIFATGDLSSDLAEISKAQKITIVSEAVQQDIFN